MDFFACPSFNALELAARRRIVEAAFARILLAAVGADAHAGVDVVAAILASHFFGAACHYSRCSAGKLIILCYQILADVNTEFVQYKLFVCRKVKKFVHADVLDAHFEGVPPPLQRAGDRGGQAAGD